MSSLSDEVWLTVTRADVAVGGASTSHARWVKGGDAE
jgi:hypothetical protein